MHRSRIGIVLIDHPEDVYDRTLEFWSGVVGQPPQPQPNAPYAFLSTLAGSLKLEAQRTGHGTPSRIHLDIETDDIPAEVARLERLGAVVEQRSERIAVMRDPGGLVFCVVGVQTDPTEFDKHAMTWE